MQNNDYLVKLDDKQFADLMTAISNKTNIHAELYDFAGKWTRYLQGEDADPFVQHNWKIADKIKNLKIKGLRCVNVGRSSSTFMYNTVEDKPVPYTHMTFYTIFDVKFGIFSPDAWYPESRKGHYVASPTGSILAMAETEDAIIVKAAAYLAFFKTLVS